MINKKAITKLSMTKNSRLCHRKKIVISTLFAFILVMLLGCTWIYNKTHISNRPREQLMEVIPSPDELHTLKRYFNNGGATVAWSTTISVFDIEEKKEWNIYFHYREKEPEIVCWIDNETVYINEKTLNIYKDTYESFD